MAIMARLRFYLSSSHSDRAILQGSVHIRSDAQGPDAREEGGTALRVKQRSGPRSGSAGEGGEEGNLFFLIRWAMGSSASYEGPERAAGMLGRVHE